MEEVLRNFADAFDGLGIGFVPGIGGQSTALVASLDLSCSGIADVTSVRISGPWWGWDPIGGPEATEVSAGDLAGCLRPSARS